MKTYLTYIFVTYFETMREAEHKPEIKLYVIYTTDACQLLATYLYILSHFMSLFLFVCCMLLLFRSDFIEPLSD